MSDSETKTSCDDIELITEWPITASQVTEPEDQRFNVCSRLAPHSIHVEVSGFNNDLDDKRHTEKRKWNSLDKHYEKKKKRCDDVCVDFAETALAKWWRHQGRKLFAGEKLPKSTNPKTLLYWVSRTDVGKTFLSSEQHKLKILLKQGQTTAAVHAALASIEEMLGELESSAHHLLTAISLDPHNCQYKWMTEKVRRQMEMKEKQKTMTSLLPSQLQLPTMTQVQRVSSDDLSVEDFYVNFAKTKTPVIITDMVEKMTKSPWTLQHIQTVAGECSVVLKKPVTESIEWARLEDAKSMKVKDFIDKVINADGDLDLYLFDWSLPQHCMPLAEELTIPKYFAGDFLQSLHPGSQYRDTWPSLFIAPGGVSSELHVDTFGSNFWMALFQGRKKWTLYPAEEQCLLYPHLSQSMDPTFDVDVTKPDLDRFPLLSLTHPVECILQPGDLLFVPSGCPHHVTNLETSVAISANFVDTSNFDSVKEEIQINALIDPCAADLVKQMQSSEFKATQNFNIGHLDWTDFKKRPPD